MGCFKNIRRAFPSVCTWESSPGGWKYFIYIFLFLQFIFVPMFILFFVSLQCVTVERAQGFLFALPARNYANIGPLLPCWKLLFSLVVGEVAMKWFRKVVEGLKVNVWCMQCLQSWLHKPLQLSRGIRWMHRVKMPLTREIQARWLQQEVRNFCCCFPKDL